MEQPSFTVQPSARLDWFSRGCCRYLEHPWLVAASEERREAALRQALADSLHATTVLETRVVIPAVTDIAFGRLLEGDEPARLQAVRLLSEEGVHAVHAANALFRLGLPSNLGSTPAFLGVFEGLAPSVSSLARWLFVTVTETCLSANLELVSLDERVRPEVRALVAAHAADERWHAHYFGKLFARRWVQLNAAERALSCELLPVVAAAYLLPDEAAQRRQLSAAGFNAQEASEVMASARAPRAQVARALAPTVPWLLLAADRGGASTASLEQVVALFESGALHQPEGA